MRILADEDIPLVRQLFAPLGKLTTVASHQIINKKVSCYDVLLVRSITHVDAALLAGSQIQFVGSATSGIDHIDTDYLAAQGIQFVHAPGSNARAVAEYVLSCFCHFMLGAGDPKQITVGIIGCGQIGNKVRQFMQSLGIRTLINDPPLELRCASADASPVDFSLHSLAEVLTADFITLHVPLTTTGTDPTVALFASNAFALLANNAVLVNTARGEVIDASALRFFVSAHPQASVILDVWHGEPDIDVSLLQQISYGTPHIAGYTLEGRYNASMQLYIALRAAYPGIPQITLKELLPRVDTQIIIDTDNAIEAIYKAVLSSYDMRDDARALEAICAAAPDQRRQFFSSLRKNYSLRREFSATTLALKSTVSDSTAALLCALGFKISRIS